MEDTKDSTEDMVDISEATIKVVMIEIMTELTTTILALLNTKKIAYRTISPYTDQRLSQLTLITDAKLRNQNTKVSSSNQVTLSSSLEERTAVPGKNGKEMKTASTTISYSQVLTTTCHLNPNQVTNNKQSCLRLLAPVLPLTQLISTGVKRTSELLTSTSMLMSNQPSQSPLQETHAEQLDSGK